jgi:hypothetical protein
MACLLGPEAAESLARNRRDPPFVLAWDSLTPAARGTVSRRTSAQDKRTLPPGLRTLVPDGRAAREGRSAKVDGPPSAERVRLFPSNRSSPHMLRKYEAETDLLIAGASTERQRTGYENGAERRRYSSMHEVAFEC